MLLILQQIFADTHCFMDIFSEIRWESGIAHRLDASHVRKRKNIGKATWRHTLPSIWQLSSCVKWHSVRRWSTTWSWLQFSMARLIQHFFMNLTNRPLRKTPFFQKMPSFYRIFLIVSTFCQRHFFFIFSIFPSDKYFTHSYSRSKVYIFSG